MEGFLFICGVILLIMVLRNRSKQKSERREDQKQVADLTARVYLLEESVNRLGRQANTAVEESSAPVAVRRDAAPKVVTPPPPQPVKPVQPLPTEAAVAWIKATSPETPLRVPVASSPPVSSHTPPSFAATSKPTTPAPPRQAKSALDLEETLGTNWLNKLGIGILVLGLAFFIAYKLPTLPPLGKVLVGYAVSGLILGGGIWLERKDRYRILARACVGGGWALLFFVTYALYHVPAAQVLESQVVDLVLMLIVAAAMVWHTLHYKSQVVTGLAFLLAFLTVTISHSNVYSLAAEGILAAGLVVIVIRMHWFELEVFGILASYLNHYLWLKPIIEAMQGERHHFEQFSASVGMLVLYWAIFRVSYLLRRPVNHWQEQVSTFAALINPILLLALLKYQSFHPEWAFAGLLLLGAVETLLGQLPITRRRRTAVIVLSTLGVVLLVAAFPFRYSGTNLSVLWLVEAEALVLIGVWTREIVFRRLGLLTAMLVSGQMLFLDVAEVYSARSIAPVVHADLPLALVFLVACVLFYGNAHWIARRWKGLFTQAFDQGLIVCTSYIAGLMALVAAWLAFPELWTGVAWCALATSLAWVGRRFTINELRYQANVISAAAVLRLFVINFDATQSYGHLTLRLVTVSLAAALLYVTAHWNLTAEEKLRKSSWSNLLTEAHAWAATALLAVLAWYELQPVGVAVAWAMGALVLLELGLARNSFSWRLQSYIVFLAAFLRIFVVNLNADGEGISPRLYTIVPIALVFFYGYWRLRANQAQISEKERGIHAAEFCCWLGSTAIVSLLRFEIRPDWVATAWAALALGLLSIAWYSGQRVFLHQALLLSLAVAFRTVLHNFYQRSYFPPDTIWQSRWVLVGSTVALLLLALPFLFKLRRKAEPNAGGIFHQTLGILDRHPEQVFFFIAVTLLTIMLGLEMRLGMVTLSWGLEGVAVFLLALVAGERSFRLTGLGLLLLGVAKILFHDVWLQQKSDRFVTLIVLGAALLLVSFLYTRYQETIRRYL